MTIHLHPDHLDRLAAAVANDGVDAIGPALGRLITAARQAGIDSPSLAVLADPTRPEVLRQRAFAKVHAIVLAGRSVRLVDPPPPAPPYATQGNARSALRPQPSSPLPAEPARHLVSQ